MRILFTYTGFLPAVAWGGPVTVVHQNALELQRRGYRVHVAASNLLDKYHRLRPGCFQDVIDGIDAHYLDIYRLPQWPGTLGPTRLSSQARRYLANLISQVDVVHVNAIRNSIAIDAISEAHRQNKGIILQPHGTLTQTVNSIRIKQLFDKFFLGDVLRKVDAYVALQQVEAQQVIDAGGNPGRVHIIPNGLTRRPTPSTATIAEVRKRFGIPDDKQVLLFIARINRKKGADLLIQAFAQIPLERRRSLHLVIAGPDDGQLNEVKSLIKENQLSSQITLPGLLTGEDIWAAYAMADLFVLPCRIDTFPMTIIEACRAGLPMVITETCEIAHLVDGKAATITPLDTHAIANAIVRTLDDEYLRTRYASGAQDLMETVFSIEAVGDALEQLYTQVLEESRGRAY